MEKNLKVRAQVIADARLLSASAQYEIGQPGVKFLSETCFNLSWSDLVRRQKIDRIKTLMEKYDQPVWSIGDIKTRDKRKICRYLDTWHKKFLNMRYELFLHSPGRYTNTSKARYSRAVDRLNKYKIRVFSSHADNTLRMDQYHVNLLDISEEKSYPDRRVEDIVSVTRRQVNSPSSRWPAQVTKTIFHVPHNWRSNVLIPGLVTAVRGAMTIYAGDPVLDLVTGIKLYNAVWIRNSRGYNIQVHRGVIGSLNWQYVSLEYKSWYSRSVADLRSDVIRLFRRCHNLSGGRYAGGR